MFVMLFPSKTLRPTHFPRSLFRCEMGAGKEGSGSTFLSFILINAGLPIFTEQEPKNGLLGALSENKP